MEKQLFSEAILLKKIPFNNYDEKLFFFTKEFGKILLLSYGSRSNRSRRKKILSSLDFIKIYFISQNRYFILQKIESIYSNSYLLKNTKSYLTFTNFLKKLLLTLPLQEITSKDFNFFFIIFFFFIKNYINLKKENTKLLFFILDFALLKYLGIFPYFHNIKKAKLKNKFNNHLNSQIKNQKKINQLYFFLEKLTQIIQKKNKKYNFYDEKIQRKIFYFFYQQYSYKKMFLNKNYSLIKNKFLEYIN